MYQAQSLPLRELESSGEEKHAQMIIKSMCRYEDWRSDLLIIPIYKLHVCYPLLGKFYRNAHKVRKPRLVTETIFERRTKVNNLTTHPWVRGQQNRHL